MIKKIMITVGILFLIAAVVTIIILSIKFPKLMIWVGILAIIANFILWCLYMIALIDEIDETWHNINLGIYSIGLYYIVIGLKYLWENSEEIEEKIKISRNRNTTGGKYDRQRN